MKELDQLVENFFQPKRDTLGLDQLVEMVEDLMGDQILPESANTFAADINEIMTGYYLLDGSWSGFVNSREAQQALEDRKQRVGEEIYEEQSERAKEAAKEVKAWANKNGFNGGIEKVWWTARPGMLSAATGQEVDSRKNPTDVLLQFGDESFLGVSSKSTKSAGDVGFKNPGLGSISRSLGISLTKEPKDIMKKAIVDYSLPLNAKERKIYIRKNPEIQKETTQIGFEVLKSLRNNLLDHLKGMDQEELRDHITTNWLDAQGSFPYYIKVTSRGKGKNYSASVEDPVNNDKLKSLLNNKIEPLEVGETSIGIKAGDDKIMKMRFKYESEKLASSIKLSGDPW